MNYTEFYSNKKRFIYLYNESYLFDLFIENIYYNVNQTLITFVKYIQLIIWVKRKIRRET